MTPPIKDLLPRLTPILKNRHEKVQENCIDLVGRIADRSVLSLAPYAHLMEITFLNTHSFKCWIRKGKSSVQAPQCVPV